LQLPYTQEGTASICQLLAEEVSPEAPVGQPAEDGLQELIDARRTEREAVLKAFWACSPKEVSGNFSITGYDPMNMWKQDGYIYGSHFWTLSNRDTGETVTLTGEAVLEAGADRQITRYWSK